MIIPCILSLLLLLYLTLLLRICLILREGTNIGMDYWTQLTYLWFSRIFGQLHWPHSSAISFVHVPIQVMIGNIEASEAGLNVLKNLRHKLTILIYKSFKVHFKLIVACTLQYINRDEPSHGLTIPATSFTTVPA